LEGREQFGLVWFDVFKENNEIDSSKVLIN
jgi:hypothetical protein